MNEGGLRLKNKYKTNVNKDLVSVVTVVFNGEAHIEQTITSVINQSYKNVEYIIVDGGSEDNTINVLNKYNNKIDYWISEKDTGIADAFNKGINLAQGEIIGLINADDYLNEGALKMIINNYNTNNPKIICGGMQIIHPKRPLTIWYSTLDNLNKEMTIAHPATFIPKKFYIQYGGYQIDFKVAMDYELMLRMKKNNVQFHMLNIITTTMRGGGVSSRQYWKGLKEINNAKKMHLENFSNLKSQLFIRFRFMQAKTMGLMDKIGIGRFISIYFGRKIFRR